MKENILIEEAAKDVVLKGNYFTNIGNNYDFESKETGGDIETN